MSFRPQIGVLYSGDSKDFFLQISAQNLTMKRLRGYEIKVFFRLSAYLVFITMLWHSCTFIFILKVLLYFVIIVDKLASEMVDKLWKRFLYNFLLFWILKFVRLLYWQAKHWDTFYNFYRNTTDNKLVTLLLFHGNNFLLGP